MIEIQDITTNKPLKDGKEGEKINLTREMRKEKRKKGKKTGIKEYSLPPFHY